MGSLYVIGIGNGNYDDLTLKAINILNEVEFIYCDEKIYNNFINFFVKIKLLKINIMRLQVDAIVLFSVHYKEKSCNFRKWRYWNLWDC